MANTRTLRVLLIAISLFALSACGSEETPEPVTEPVVETVVVEPVVEASAEPATPAPSAEALADAQALGAIAHAIDAEPARAEAILTEHEMDRAALETRLFAVAADPALSRAYMAARTGE